MKNVLIFLIFTTYCSARAGIVGVLTNYLGKVTVDRKGTIFEVKKVFSLKENDLVITGDMSKAKIVFGEGRVAKVAKSSKVRLYKVSVSGSKDKVPLLELLFGRLRAQVRHKDSEKVNMLVKTTISVAGINRAEVIIDYNYDSSFLVTLSGEVALINPDLKNKPVIVKSGQLSKMIFGFPPMMSVNLNPEDFRKLKDSDVNGNILGKHIVLNPRGLSKTFFEPPSMGLYSPSGFLPEPALGAKIDSITGKVGFLRDFYVMLSEDTGSIVPVVSVNREEIDVRINKKVNKIFSKKIKKSYLRQEEILDEMNDLRRKRKLDKIDVLKKELVLELASRKKLIADKSNIYSYEKYRKMSNIIRTSLGKNKSGIDLEILKAKLGIITYERKIEEYYVEGNLIKSEKLKALIRNDSKKIQDLEKKESMLGNQIVIIDRKRELFERLFIQFKIYKIIDEYGHYLVKDGGGTIPVIIKNYENNNFLEVKVKIKNLEEFRKDILKDTLSIDDFKGGLLPVIVSRDDDFFIAPDLKSLMVRVKDPMKNLCSDFDAACSKEIKKYTGIGFVQDAFMGEDVCLKNPDDILCKASFAVKSEINPVCKVKPDHSFCKKTAEIDLCLKTPDDPVCKLDIIDQSLSQGTIDCNKYPNFSQCSGGVDCRRYPEDLSCIFCGCKGGCGCYKF